MKTLLRQKRIWIPAVAVIVLAGLFGLICLARDAYTGPLHCQTCHAAETKQWLASGPHSTETHCTDCHAPWPHAAPARVNLLKQYRDEILPTDVRAGRERIDGNCRHCHDEVLRAGYVASGTVSMGHRLHLDEGMDCVDCHANISHDSMTGQTYRPPKRVCYECHLRDIDAGSRRDGSCRTCHRILLSRDDDR